MNRRDYTMVIAWKQLNPAQRRVLLLAMRHERFVSNSPPTNLHMGTLALLSIETVLGAVASLEGYLGNQQSLVMKTIRGVILDAVVTEDKLRNAHEEA